MSDKRPAMVSSLSIAWKKATAVQEDVAEAKREHRQNLRTLTEKYMKDVADGKAEGIRNAKELVEVIKADLLLMGEASERTENNNAADEVRISKVQAALDENDPNVQSIMSEMLMLLNGANDAQDEYGDGTSESQEQIEARRNASLDDAGVLTKGGEEDEVSSE